MKQTAVEWLLEQIDDAYIHQIYDKEFNQAKEMEKKQCQDYARFAIECDRKDLPILDFNGYSNLIK